MKTLRDLQKAFVEETGVKAWEEVVEKFPEYASAEALDQFIEENPTNSIADNKLINTFILLDSKFL